VTRIAKVCKINDFHVHINVLFNDSLYHSVITDDRRLSVIVGFGRMIVTRGKLSPGLNLSQCYTVYSKFQIDCPGIVPGTL